MFWSTCICLGLKIFLHTTIDIYVVHRLPGITCHSVTNQSVQDRGDKYVITSWQVNMSSRNLYKFWSPLLTDWNRNVTEILSCVSLLNLIEQSTSNLSSLKTSEQWKFTFILALISLKKGYHYKGKPVVLHASLYIVFYIQQSDFWTAGPLEIKCCIAQSTSRFQWTSSPWYSLVVAIRDTCNVGTIGLSTTTRITAPWLLEMNFKM